MKQNDDLMSSTRIGVMQIRSAKPITGYDDKFILSPDGRLVRIGNRAGSTRYTDDEHWGF